MSLQELVLILQIAIGPVILISGIGLLLLSMTNRFGRLLDRSRQISKELRLAAESEREVLLSQIGILSKRALLLRQAITLATISMLLAAALVITLFVAAVFRLEAAIVVVVLFVCCMGCLIGALTAFLRDINQSLAALKLELGPLWKD